MEPDDTRCSALHQQLQINPQSCATQQNYGGKSTTRPWVADEDGRLFGALPATYSSLQYPVSLSLDVEYCDDVIVARQYGI